MNPHTMTISECRDELARLEGWAEVDHGWMNDNELVNDHPIPDTLDEAAKLPPGWFVEIVKHPLDALSFCCKAWNKNGGPWLTSVGTTEKEARFRLRLLCEMEVKR